MVSDTRFVRALAVTLAAVTVLAGCAYNGKANGTIGDSLTFSISSDRKTEMTFTVLDLERVDASDADSWGIERSGGDVYFAHYSASQVATTVSSDWAVATESDEVFFARSSLQPPGSGIPETVCDEFALTENPCVVFIVPSGESVASVRYYGVDSGYVRGGGVGSSEWVAWSVE